MYTWLFFKESNAFVMAWVHKIMLRLFDGSEYKVVTVKQVVMFYSVNRSVRLSKRQITYLCIIIYSKLCSHWRKEWFLHHLTLINIWLCEAGSITHLFKQLCWKSVHFNEQILHSYFCYPLPSWRNYPIKLSQFI